MDYEAPLNSRLWEELRTETLKIVRPIFREAFLAGVHAGLLMLPRKGRRDALPLPALPPDLFDQDWLNNMADFFIQGYSDRWWAKLSIARQDALRKAILEARAGGLGPNFVMDQIAPLFDASSVSRIAVTEMTRLIGEGARQTYAAAGIPSWEWKTANDSLVDPICDDLEGQIFPVTEPFVPGHPGCRCVAAPYGEMDLSMVA